MKSELSVAVINLTLASATGLAKKFSFEDDQRGLAGLA